MSVDAHANFAYSTVATAPSPASSGTSLTVASGGGALLPSPPFNMTSWAAGASPFSTNSEIIRVTAVSSDTLTIVRQQEGTSARSILVGDPVAINTTAKTLTDIENLEPLYYKDEPFVIASGDLFIVSSLAWMDATFLDSTSFSNYEPLADRVFWPGSTTEFYEDPFILDSPWLADLGANSGTVVWTDSARAPQVVSTLLIIGV